MLLICAAVVAFTVSLAQSREGFVLEGESFENILIGKSTMDDVIAAYGTNYELVKHRDYSNQIIYKNLGLSFYSCQADPNKEIFVVQIEAPFKAVTGRGITLGESTYADVVRLYGKVNESSAGLEYQGVYFNSERQKLEKPQSQQQQVNLKAGESQKTNVSNLLINKNENTTFIIDGAEVSNARAGSINRANELQAKNNNNKKVSGEDDEIADLEIYKTRIVNRIELVEQSGLRQCEVKFRNIKR